MKYRIESEFTGDAATVLKAMFERDIGDRLKPLMRHIQELETLDWEAKDGVIRRRVRYRPVPKIESVGPKRIEPRWMEWIEESTANLTACTVEYRNVPTTPRVAELLTNSGRMTFDTVSGTRVRRAVACELHVDVFLLGAIAERIIYSYAKEIVDEEAMALGQILAAR